MDLKGKVALVTGGASGHGREYCKELFKQGCKVAICDINADAGEELLHQLSKNVKDRVIFLPCDVTDYMQFEEAFQTTISQLGGVDIVINNAAVMNDRLWELEVDVNLNGVIRGLLLAFRFLGKDRGGPGGIVVNAGSSCCKTPLVSLPDESLLFQNETLSEYGIANDGFLFYRVYTSTKYAVAALTRCYGDAYHVNLTGVKVVSLCPTPTDAEISGDPRKRILSGEYEQAWLRDTSSSAPVKPENLGKALVEVVQNAKSGTSWLVSNDHPPKEIPLL